MHINRFEKDVDNINVRHHKFNKKKQEEFYLHM